MSYVLHHAIVVTSYGEDTALARAKAVDLGMLVTGLVKDGINGYASFLVVPDGSKEGWSESDQGDNQRAEFVQWMRESKVEDGKLYLNWVEVQFGCSEYGIRTQVLNHSEEGREAFHVLSRLGVTGKIPDDLHDEIQDSL